MSKNTKTPKHLHIYVYVCSLAFVGMHCYVGGYILTSVTPAIAKRPLPITSLECCHTLHQNVHTMLSDSPLVVSPLPCSSVGAPPCNLVCLSNANFYTTRGVVADGTSCSPSNDYDKAICLRGACTVSMRGCQPLVTIPVFISFACMLHLLWQLCEAAIVVNIYPLSRSPQNVGCDNRFDGAQSDRCGVCNGDGSSCSLVQRTFSATNQQFGEQKHKSLSCSVCPDECSLTLYGSVLHV